MQTKAFNTVSLYVLYVLTAILNFWIIVFTLGFSNGLANYFPVFALAGSILLFVIASPLLVYLAKAGLIVGLFNLIFIFPFSIGFTISLLGDWSFSWSLLLVATPGILVWVSLYVTIKHLHMYGSFTLIKPINKTVKLLLSAIPVLLFALYIVCYGKDWDLSRLFH